MCVRTVNVHAVEVRGGHVAERPHKHQHVRSVARRKLHQGVSDECGAEGVDPGERAETEEAAADGENDLRCVRSKITPKEEMQAALAGT